jgi:hypothetical protein
MCMGRWDDRVDDLIGFDLSEQTHELVLERAIEKEERRADGLKEPKLEEKRETINHLPLWILHDER